MTLKLTDAEIEEGILGLRAAGVVPTSDDIEYLKEKLANSMIGIKVDPKIVLKIRANIELLEDAALIEILARDFHRT
jgi:hypothetical protein